MIKTYKIIILEAIFVVTIHCFFFWGNCRHVICN